MNNRISRYGSSAGSDMTKLFQILKSIKEKYYVKVGILGGSSSRMAVATIQSGKNKGKRKASKTQKSYLTNAQLGAIHEFGRIAGKPKIPPRSFLRVPIFTHLPGRIDKVKAFALKALEKGKMKIAYDRLGAAAEDVVQEAFESHGFGQWAPNAPATRARKKSDSPLIDTAQLRKSISWETVKV